VRNLSRVAVLVTAALSPSTATAAAQVYDAVTDYVGTNGSGPWSYLQRSGTNVSSLPTAFSQCANPLVSGFGTVGAFNIPAVYFNKSPGPVSCSTVTLAANAGYIHPGFDFTDAMLRFTAPTAGSYAITGGIWSADVNGTGFTIALEDQGAIFFSATTTFFSPSGAANTSFNLTRTLNAGDVIDLVAKPKNGSDVSFGTTGFRLTMTRSPITTVPEPSSAMLLLTGALGIFSHARRSRRTKQG
jgi:hypothetical protein